MDSAGFEHEVWLSSFSYLRGNAISRAAASRLVFLARPGVSRGNNERLHDHFRLQAESTAS